MSRRVKHFVMVMNMLFVLPLVTLLLPYVELAEEEECSPFPFATLEHGRIIPSGHQRFSFVCGKNYFLVSKPVVRCFKGNWTSLKKPECQKRVNLCDEPPEVANAVVKGEDREIGNSVKYMCKSGYTLVGKDEMTCAEGRFWRGRTPTCMDEAEPLAKLAERLNNSFVNNIGEYTTGTKRGRLLERTKMLYGLELVLLMDRSSSVDPVHLEHAKTFIKFLLRSFGVNNNAVEKAGTRAAVITFGTDIQKVFNVDNKNITGPDAADVAVDSIQPNGGGTNLEGALTYVITDIVEKLRPKAKKALFIMTDGEPNIGNPAITPQDMANELMKQEFEIFTVGIGSGINQRLLADLASQPPLSHVFVLSKYPDLNEIMKIIRNEKEKVLPISKDQCGYMAPDEDRPWIAVVYVAGSPMKLCGGVLICSQWVLTAASCLQEGGKQVKNEDIFVSLGERDLLNDDSNKTNFYTEDVRIHPGFDSSIPLKNNLALINLNKPETPFRPACLPGTDRQIPLHLNLNVNALIEGWGVTADSGPTLVTAASVLFKMESTPASLTEEDLCPGKQRGLPLICAQGLKTCLGLMGSPLMAEDSVTGFNHVLGITAGRTHCLRGDNQYIELTKYLRWINQQTEACQLKHWGI